MSISKQRIERRLALRARRRSGEHHVSIYKRMNGQREKAAAVVRSLPDPSSFLSAMKDFIERFNFSKPKFERRRKAFGRNP